MGCTRFFRRKQWDTEWAREIESYLEIETDENIARGMPPKAAQEAAMRKFGNPTTIRERIYHMNSLGLVDQTLQDSRYALRQLRRS